MVIRIFFREGFLGFSQSPCHFYLYINGLQGIVVVTFVVDEKGNINNVQVLRGIGGGCDEEAVRLVKNSGVWTPGKIDGKAVSVQLRLPVQFKL